MPTTPIQAIINTGADAGLSTVYAQTSQQVPVVTNATVYITNKTEVTNNVINQDVAGGIDTEVQFNIGDRLVGDSGFTYDQDTDSLSIAGNVFAGQIRTDILKYANGANWSFTGSYANSNVAAYLPVYTGNLTANNIAANTLSGNGYAITFITGSNVDGEVANATFATSANSATTAGTVTTQAQPNITSVGTLSALTVGGTATATLFSGSGANLTNLNASNLSGAVASATTAGTVTTQAQPNITSVGTLSTLSVTGNVTGSYFLGNGSQLTGVTATVAQTVSNAAQPNITSLGTLANVAVDGNANIGSNGIVTIANTTQSTNLTSGALQVAGGISSQANIHGNHIHAYNNVYAQQTLYAGQNSIAQGVLTNPVIIAKTTGATYVQAAIINASNTGSADWIAYNDEYPGPADDHGWIDMGMAGSAFNDPLYTITKPHDGYIFTGSTTGTPGGGNLVFATDSTGTTKDIVFATGGFLAADEKFRYVHSTNKLVPYSNASMGLGNTTNYFGNVYANMFIGDGSLLTGVTATAAPSSNIINGTSTVDIAAANSNVTITSGALTWNFDTSGNFNLANTNGIIEGLPNSSGDGGGYSTMRLYPDPTLIGGDQYLIIDPTGPGHIHLRAGGTQDNSLAELFFGGEYTHLKLASGANSNVEIRSNSFPWIFDNTGNITIPKNILSPNTFTVGTANSNIQFDQTTGPTSLSGKGNVWIYANLAQYNFSDTGAIQAQSPLTIESSGNITLAVTGNANSNVTFANAGMFVTANATANYFLGNGSQLTGLPSTFTTKFGYSSGNTVTQTTNRGQGVTINSLSGTIITTSDTIAAGDLDIFPVNNNQVDPTTDIVLAQVVSYNPGVYLVIPQPTGTPSNGFYLTIRNVDQFASPTETITIRFTVIKAPNA